MKGKTNAMRLLEQAKIPFSTVEYEVDESDLSGEHVAAQLNQPVEQVFKTLVVREKRMELWYVAFQLQKNWI